MRCAMLHDPYVITSLEALAQHYEAPRELVLRKVAARLDTTARAFIAASPFLCAGYQR